jgi:drug/metabolite transporter (DMT)-like permease
MPRLYDFSLLLIVFFAGGMTSVTEKWFKTALPATSTHIYTFYGFLFSIALLVLARVFIRVPKAQLCEPGKRREKLVGFIPYSVVMGAAVYGVTYFKTLANEYLDTIVLYPLNNGLTFVGSCLMAWACFGEKPNRNSIIGMALVLSALLLSSGTAEAIFKAIFA